ncbi:hypothetical protein B296_00034685 [Ensete ventricosum]|uniref:Plant heme peroxidase family profile domain-containing protein n=1 Tax=Ensete ventricosum TaxID=4639 RepID=A0A426ZEW7_ENSVE|nr:hypothetical protein B296_00034685 [Ensete ventricosum]
MAVSCKTFLTLLLLSLLASAAHGQLSTRFYDRTCPKLRGIVRSVMAQAVFRDRRMGASILRLFFHDCFVNVRYPFSSCNLTPRSLTNLSFRVAMRPIFAANANLPLASSSLSDLISLFARKGLDARDMTALSGAHTIGQARCVNFRPHIYGDGNIDPGFAALRRQTCPAFGGDGNLAPLDLQTPVWFDNRYYKNLVARRGLLHSDQELFNGGSQDSLVRLYSSSTLAFFNDFVAAMVKMGNISPLTGWRGEIRLRCRKLN